MNLIRIRRLFMSECLTVTGEAPQAKVAIQNTSTDASSFEWTFSEGADTNQLSVESPPTLTVDKTGTFTIKLVAKNGSEKKEMIKEVTIAGRNAVATFKDVEFAHTDSNALIERLFSFETGKTYKDSEIDSTTGPLISLGFVSWGLVMYYFESPDISEHTKLKITGATKTKVMNSQVIPSVSKASFEAMTDDRLLSTLEIEDLKDSFGNKEAKGNTILFETSERKKGVILTKGVNSERLLVDINVQKY